MASKVTHGMTWLVRALEADETRRRRKDAAEELHIPAFDARRRLAHSRPPQRGQCARCFGAGQQRRLRLGPHALWPARIPGRAAPCRTVAIIREVEFFDDSKGTNVGATVAALQGLGADRRVVVILGGDGKGQDFSPLADPVQRFARGVVLIGRDAPVIREALQGTDVPLHDAADMQAAVAQAAAIAAVATRS